MKTKSYGLGQGWTAHPEQLPAPAQTGTGDFKMGDGRRDNP